MTDRMGAPHFIACEGVKRHLFASRCSLKMFVNHAAIDAPTDCCIVEEEGLR